jgi:hypothetical protein
MRRHHSKAPNILAAVITLTSNISQHPTTVSHPAVPGSIATTDHPQSVAIATNNMGEPIHQLDAKCTNAISEPMCLSEDTSATPDLDKSTLIVIQQNGNDLEYSGI